MILRRLLVPLVISLSCVACGGGGDGDGDGGPTSNDGADRALADMTCYLGLQLPGITHSGSGCSGTDLRTSVTGFKGSSLDPALRVNLELGTAPALGALDLTTLTVDVPDATGADQSWQAPAGGCTAQAAGHQRDDFFEWDYYRIDLSCSEPAAGIDGNSGAPLTLGDFTVVSFFAPN